MTLNALIAGGDESREILTDERNVLMNYNIHARATPGSIFKMVASLGALMEGELLPDETIDRRRAVYALHQGPNPPRRNAGFRRRSAISTSIKPSCRVSPTPATSSSTRWARASGEERLYQYASEFGLTSRTGVDLPGESRSVVGNQTSLYDPSKPMGEASQDTARAIIVFNSIKKHLRNQGAIRNITYDDESLNRCVKRLMDMAVNTGAGRLGCVHPPHPDGRAEHDARDGLPAGGRRRYLYLPQRYQMGRRADHSGGDRPVHHRG